MFLFLFKSLSTVCQGEIVKKGKSLNIFYSLYQEPVSTIIDSNVIGAYFITVTFLVMGAWE